MKLGLGILVWNGMLINELNKNILIKCVSLEKNHQRFLSLPRIT